MGRFGEADSALVSMTDPHSPDIDGPIQVTMRVASRGNVLAHEIAPGGVPEPAMVYLEGASLYRTETAHRVVRWILKPPVSRIVMVSRVCW
jgi:hypothetical protein